MCSADKPPPDIPEKFLHLDTNLDDSSLDISLALPSRSSRCAPGGFDFCFVVYFLLLNLIVSVLVYFVLILVSR